MPEILAYYQTFQPLSKTILRAVDRLIVSSVHFNLPSTVHLNDDPLASAGFDKVFALPAATSIMLGGAGGGFRQLFSSPEAYRGFVAQLKKTLADKCPRVREVVLDVEEPGTSAENLNKLISDLSPEFSIAMSPCAFALTGGGTGLGGFNYRDIRGCSRFYVQAYDSSSFNARTLKLIRESWPDQEIVMGCLSSTADDPAQLLRVTKDMPSVVVWDVGTDQGQQWARIMIQGRQLETWSRRARGGLTRFEAKKMIARFWSRARNEASETTFGYWRIPSAVSRRILEYLLPLALTRSSRGPRRSRLS